MRDPFICSNVSKAKFLEQLHEEIRGDLFAKKPLQLISMPPKLDWRDLVVYWWNDWVSTRLLVSRNKTHCSAVVRLSD